MYFFSFLIFFIFNITHWAALNQTERFKQYGVGGARAAWRIGINFISIYMFLLNLDRLAERRPT